MQDKYAEAEEIDNRALEISRRVLGPENPVTLKCTSAVVKLYLAQHRTLRRSTSQTGFGNQPSCAGA